jgi:glycosyltransferase involved in cell wall biosynthesis
MSGVSIALATFNGERYLAAQLASLAAQTHLPAELVVTDDCSDDRSIAIAQDFARGAPFPVTVVRNERRLGYRLNFLRAAGRCSADLIAYCDQDDLWDPDKLAAMTQPFAEPEVLLAYHNAIVIGEDGGRLGDLYAASPGVRTFAPLALEPWSLVAGFTQVFRRSLLRFSALHAASIDAYWPDEPMAHDQWQLFLASALGAVVRVGGAHARYRQHGDNVFGWENRAWLERPPGHFLRGESFVAAAGNRAELLRAMSGLLSAAERPRAQAAIVYYEALARRLDDRMAIYSSAALSARIARFQTLLRQRAYSRAQGSGRFGWKGLLMDGFGGVPLGSAMKRML